MQEKIKTLLDQIALLNDKDAFTSKRGKAIGNGTDTPNGGAIAQPA